MPTGWLINNRNVSPTVLEAGESKTKVQAHLVPGEGPTFWFTDGVFTLWMSPHGKGAAWDPLCKGTNPVHEGSPHDLITSQRPDLLLSS